MAREDKSPYRIARERAREYNEVLSTREGASELLHVSPTSLKHYENGITKVPMDIVLEMADLYNAPDLPRKYCARDCPIGQRRGDEDIDMSAPVERVALHVGIAAGGVDALARDLAEVAADGQVTAAELPKARAVIAQLERLKHAAESAALVLRMACKATERSGTC